MYPAFGNKFYDDGKIFTILLLAHYNHDWVSIPRPLRPLSWYAFVRGTNGKLTKCLGKFVYSPSAVYIVLDVIIIIRTSQCSEFHSW